MSGEDSFSAVHAEAEIERLQRASKTVEWKTPGGEVFSLVIPPTVYPPREDTDLLASVLTSQRLPPNTRWLEIGCGSGALSLHAARLGCHITACDVNPMAVACTRAHFAQNGLSARVLEGGPGPSTDGGLAQWGGDQTYDVVVWNTPYIGVDALSEGMLGPMEEAGLTDTDHLGLFVRTVRLIATTSLLSKDGMAYLTVSSRGAGQTACEVAWSEGVAARRLSCTAFEDGEELSVIALWKPYADAPMVEKDATASTNDDVLKFGKVSGATVRADVQTSGRGRRGRTWTSYDGALMASWLIHTGEGWPHSTRDQLRVGDAIVRLIRAKTGRTADDVCLKWPNDLFLRNHEGDLKKAGGVLFEAVSQGDAHHLVVGLGINLEVGGDDHASVREVGFNTRPERLHVMLHAMMASLFQEVPQLPKPSPSLGVEREVINGVSLLGPIFYRKKEATVIGLSPSGALVLANADEPVDEPDDVVWSGL